MKKILLALLIALQSCQLPSYAAYPGTPTGTGAPVNQNTPTLITPVLGAATATSITATGNVSGDVAVFNNLNVGGTLTGLISSGTYTPTPSNTTNLLFAPAIIGPWQYMRIGNIVTVSGLIFITPSVTNNTFSSFITAPVTPNFISGVNDQLGGTCITDPNVAAYVPQLAVPSANDAEPTKILISGYSAVTIGSTLQYSCVFTYRLS